MTERDDRSTEKVTGGGPEFSRLAGFLARELALPVLTLGDGGDDRDAGAPPAAPATAHAACAAWAACGAMWLTGHPDGPPRAPAGAVALAVGAAARTAAQLGAGPVDVAEVLTGRAAWMGLRRAGRTSANGSCRLLPAGDGWVAVNLARPSDVEAVPALIERAVDGDPWAALARAVADRPAAAVVERATLLGLPVAALPGGAGPGPGPRPGPGEPAPFRVLRRGEAQEGGPPDGARPLVVDLSSMWAGPLCARLLGRTGMRVVKVESTSRPDGARAGDARFYAWLHAGHESVALDLATESGRQALRDLVGRADVVLESSRPRALAQLGVEAERVVAARPGVTWVSITGHGRTPPSADRVAFGDDAAVAAGLVAGDGRGEPVFCADAVADPITGLYAAAGALASQAAGGGHLLDVAMVEAARFAAATPAPPVAAVEDAPGRWVVPGAGGAPPQPVVPPAPPRLDPGARESVRPLGADTPRVLADLPTSGPTGAPR